MAHVSALPQGNHCSRERCLVESAALSALFSATVSGDVWICILRTSWSPFAKMWLRLVWRYFLFRGDAKILLRASKWIDSGRSTCL